jgi:lipopolysaccharide export system protein LptA
MTARTPVNLGSSDQLLSSQSFSLESSSDQTVRQESDHDSSEMKEALTTLMGGVSGLILTLSLILFLQAPLISVLVIFALASGWGGSAYNQTHQKS